MPTFTYDKNSGALIAELSPMEKEIVKYKSDNKEVAKDVEAIAAELDSIKSENENIINTLEAIVEASLLKESEKKKAMQDILLNINGDIKEE